MRFAFFALEREENCGHKRVKSSFEMRRVRVHFPPALVSSFPQTHAGDVAGAGRQLRAFSGCFIISPKVHVGVREIKLKACNLFYIDIYIKGTTMWELM